MTVREKKRRRSLLSASAGKGHQVTVEEDKDDTTQGAMGES